MKHYSTIENQVRIKQVSVPEDRWLTPEVRAALEPSVGPIGQIDSVNGPGADLHAAEITKAEAAVLLQHYAAAIHDFNLDAKEGYSCSSGSRRSAYAAARLRYFQDCGFISDGDVKNALAPPHDNSIEPDGVEVAITSWNSIATWIAELEARQMTTAVSEIRPLQHDAEPIREVLRIDVPDDALKNAFAVTIGGEIADGASTLALVEYLRRSLSAHNLKELGYGVSAPNSEHLIVQGLVVRADDRFLLEDLLLLAERKSGRNLGVVSFRGDAAPADVVKAVNAGLASWLDQTGAQPIEAWRFIVAELEKLGGPAWWGDISDPVVADVLAHRLMPCKAVLDAQLASGLTERARHSRPESEEIVTIGDAATFFHEHLKCRWG